MLQRNGTVAAVDETGTILLRVTSVTEDASAYQQLLQLSLATHHEEELDVLKGTQAKTEERLGPKETRRSRRGRHRYDRHSIRTGHAVAVVRAADGKNNYAAVSTAAPRNFRM
jgi:hypothetical protein